MASETIGICWRDLSDFPHRRALRRPCDACDNCDSGRAEAVASAGGSARFGAAQRVRHVEWGEGEVVRADDDTVVVVFDDKGYRTLALELVEEGGLLEIV